MPDTALAYLEARLREALQRVQRFRESDDGASDEFREALEESRSLLGAIARYRHWLEQSVLDPSHRCAA